MIIILSHSLSPSHFLRHSPHLFPPQIHEFRWGERCHPLSLAHHPVQHGIKLVACESHERASVGLRLETLVVRPLVGAHPVQRDGAFDFDFELVGFASDVATEIADRPLCVLKIFWKRKTFFVQADIVDEREIVESMETLNKS